MDFCLDMDQGILIEVVNIFIFSILGDSALGYDRVYVAV